MIFCLIIRVESSDPVIPDPAPIFLTELDRENRLLFVDKTHV